MPPDTLKLAVDVVASYVSRNTLAAADVPDLIRSTYTALNTLGTELGQRGRAARGSS